MTGVQTCALPIWPVNRGVEICDLAMDYERCLINRQVENGIACRMSILYHLTPQTQH